MTITHVHATSLILVFNPLGILFVFFVFFMVEGSGLIVAIDHFPYRDLYSGTLERSHPKIVGFRLFAYTHSWRLPASFHQVGRSPASRGLGHHERYECDARWFFERWATCDEVRGLTSIYSPTNT